MTVDVELYGQLSPDLKRRQILDLKRPMTVKEVAILLKMKPEEIGLIAINGVQSELHDSVPVNCRLCFFPPLSGG